MLTDIQLGLLLLFAGWLVPAALALRRRRDLADPRVAYVGLYALFTAGPVLLDLASGGDGSTYYRGVVVEHVGTVLLLCATAAWACALGTSLALRGSPEAAPPPGPDQPADDRQLVLAAASAALCLLVLWIHHELARTAGSDDKSEVLTLGGAGWLRAFRLGQSAMLLVGLALVARDAVRSPSRPGTATLVALSGQTVTCLLLGERDVVFVLGAAVYLGLGRWSCRTLALAGGGLLTLVAIVPLLRDAGLSLETQARQASTLGAGELLPSLARQTGVNLFIFSRLVEWVPDVVELRWGGTYLDALVSFLPWETEASSRSLVYWFKDAYAPTGVSGYGFAIDAEAYLNFGAPGPALWFLCVGLLLGRLRARSRAGPPSALVAYLEVLVLVACVFSFRSDARGLIKLCAFGAVAGQLLVGTPLRAREARPLGESP